MVSCFAKIRIPSFFAGTVGRTVSIFPTLLQDVKSIRQAMRFRGIALNGWSYVRHPLQTVEYFFDSFIDVCRKYCHRIVSDRVSKRPVG